MCMLLSAHRENRQGLVGAFAAVECSRLEGSSLAVLHDRYTMSMQSSSMTLYFQVAVLILAVSMMDWRIEVLVPCMHASKDARHHGSDSPMPA
jgi:hypothetical protein